jgi:polar amino acid transport system substrate-binding protein
MIGLLLIGARADTIKTLEPGVLNVGLNGDMPMTSVKDGKLTGSDGEIMSLIAERLPMATRLLPQL